MFQVFKTVAAAAPNAGTGADNQRQTAMEGDTILKHRRSSKSQTSRGNFLKTAFFAVWVVSIFTFSCSSPEKDGLIAAKMWCDCLSEFSTNMENVYDSFIENFETYSFTSREEANNKLGEYTQIVWTEFDECEDRVSELGESISNKYNPNKDNIELLCHTYNKYVSEFYSNNPITWNAKPRRAQRIISDAFPLPPITSFSSFSFASIPATGSPDYELSRKYYSASSVFRLCK